MSDRPMCLLCGELMNKCECARAELEMFPYPDVIRRFFPDPENGDEGEDDGEWTEYKHAA